MPQRATDGPGRRSALASRLNVEVRKGRVAPLACHLAVTPEGGDALGQYVRTAPGRFALDIAGRQALKAARARLCRRLVQFEARENRAETGPNYRERTCVLP